MGVVLGPASTRCTCSAATATSFTAALGDRAAASTLVREAVARGYAYEGITHADPELGALFP